MSDAVNFKWNVPLPDSNSEPLLVKVYSFKPIAVTFFADPFLIPVTETSTFLSPTFWDKDEPLSVVINQETIKHCSVEHAQWASFIRKQWSIRVLSVGLRAQLYVFSESKSKHEVILLIIMILFKTIIQNARAWIKPS